MSELIKHELALVMPVYNEEECIVDVLQAWRDELNRLEIDYIILVLNDGSRDGTRQEIAKFNGDSRVQIINKENSGHGPTILLGYSIAAKEASWIFQTDSDNEMSPLFFKELWVRRYSFDALLGCRIKREQGVGRKFISTISRCAVRLFFGSGVTDVNTPYRLIRAPLLARIIKTIPFDTFAPNVIISGVLAVSGSNIYNHPVPHERRRTGKISIVKWKLWRVVVEAFYQTLIYRCVYNPGKNSNESIL